MQRVRMVPVTRVADAFGARILAARLGSDGILTQLRGGVDGPYPMGIVEVLVSADDLEVAREILLAEEVESAFDEVEPPFGPDVDDVSPPAALARWVVLSVVIGLVLFAYVNTIGYQSPSPGPDLDRSGAEEPG